MELNVQVEVFVFLLQNYQFSGITSSIQFFGEISLELLTVFQSLRRKAIFFFFYFSFWTSSKFINVILNIEIHIYI